MFEIVPTITELYFRVAKGKIDLTKLREIDQMNGLFKIERKPSTRKRKSVRDYESEFVTMDPKKATLRIGDDFQGFDYQMAKCCNPIPGDQVFGFITVSSGIKIHRFNCPNAVNMMSKMEDFCTQRPKIRKTYPRNFETYFWPDFCPDFWPGFWLGFGGVKKNKNQGQMQGKTKKQLGKAKKKKETLFSLFFPINPI